MAGQTFSRYRVINELGSAGMGVVYRAHEHDQRGVTIEIYRPASTGLYFKSDKP